MKLENKIREIVALSKEYKGYYSTNETAVRDQLINPILNELGWNTLSPLFVRHNTPNSNGKIPDYTLFKNNKNILVIEAKNLNTQLKDDKVIMQLSGYSYNMGISFGVLTNGIKWLLFNTFEKIPNDRVVWYLDFENENQDFDANIKKLKDISYINVEMLEDEVKKHNILENSWLEFCPNKNQLFRMIEDKFNEKLKKENPNLVYDQNIFGEFINDKINGIFETKTLTVKPNTPTKTRSKRKNKRRSTLRVTFDDGFVIQESKAAQTLVDVIKKVGIEEVKKLGLIFNGGLLIQDFENKGLKYKTQYRADKYFITIYSSTETKVKLLKKLSEKMGLALKIEVV